jgi:putative two-component system response regulator
LHHSEHAYDASGTASDGEALPLRGGESLQDLIKVLDATVLAMAAMAEPGEAGNHILRIQHYVRALGHKLKTSAAHGRPLSERAISLFFRAVPLHDIGNAGVPDRILLKPGPLSEEELAVVRTHPAAGRRAIDQIKKSAGLSTEFLEAAREIAYSHHERWDGTGYPQRLSGDSIPVAARLLAIADAYDALTSDRVYRAGVPHDKAVQQIFQERAAHFDPEMVDAFIEIQDEFAAIAQRFADTEGDLQKKIDYMAKAIAESP